MKASWLFKLTLLCGGMLAASKGVLGAPADRGHNLYQLCASCHGDNGQGKKNLAAPAIAGLPEWYIKKQLSNFREGHRGLHPRDDAGNRMRPMAKMLKKREKENFDDLDLVASYVAALPKPAVVSQLSIGNGDPAKGKNLYAVCVACHGDKAQGMVQMNAPALTTLDDWYLFTQLKNFKSGLRGADAARDPQGALMVPMAKNLVDDQAMRDVIAYIKTLP